MQVLPEYLSKWTTEKVRSEGVRVLPNTSVTSAILDPVSNKLILTTSNGDVIKADHAIVAVGIKPDTSIAKESDLEVDKKLGGFKVNEELEAKYESQYSHHSVIRPSTVNITLCSYSALVSFACS